MTWGITAHTARRLCPYCGMEPGAEDPLLAPALARLRMPVRRARRRSRPCSAWTKSVRSPSSAHWRTGSGARRGGRPLRVRAGVWTRGVRCVISARPGETLHLSRPIDAAQDRHSLDGCGHEHRRGARHFHGGSLGVGLSTIPRRRSNHSPKELRRRPPASWPETRLSPLTANRSRRGPSSRCSWRRRSPARPDRVRGP